MLGWLALIGLVICLLGFAAAVARLLDTGLRLVVRRVERHGRR